MNRPPGPGLSFGGSGSGRSGAPVRSPLDGGPLNRMRQVSPFSATLLLAVTFFALLGFYVLLDSPLLLVALIAVTVAGTDRVLRRHAESRFHGVLATALYVFVPALYALAVALLLRDLSGLMLGPALVAASAIFAIVVNAEYLTVAPNPETYDAARLLLHATVLLVSLAIFAVVYIAELRLPLAVAMVAGAALLLTVDMLRDLESNTRALFTLAGAVAVVMGEARLALALVPLTDLLAGAFLMVTYYVLTGLVLSHVSGRLDRRTWLTYALVAAAGYGCVALGRTII